MSELSMAHAHTVPDLIREAADKFGPALALVDEGTRLSFQDLYTAARRGAAGLHVLGIRPGDAVGIWAPNSAEWVIASLGAALAGAVLVPVNTRYKGDEATGLLNRAKVRVIFTSRGFLGLDFPAMLAGADSAAGSAGADSAAGSAAADSAAGSAGADSAAGSAAVAIVILRGEARPGETAWAEFLAGPADRSFEHTPDPDDVSHVQFTSGTTGTPKGAMLRHRALCGTTRDWVANVGLVAGDRYGIISPFFHVSGHKTAMLACLTAGATMYPQPVFDPVAVMACVERERITVLPGPPTVYQTLLAHPRRGDFDLTSLRLAVTGAASIPPVLIERMFDELGFREVITAYGITETTGVVTMCRPGDNRLLIAQTSGRVVSGVEMSIVGDDGRAVPPGKPGEIRVRGYNLMAGYLDDPDATAAAVDEDGWFHSGDVGWQDDDGNLRITDRLGDIFIVGGFNAYPAEIEAVLARHPHVAQVAVIGCPDDRLGEVGEAFVVLDPSVPPAEFDGSALITWCRERLANYKIPRAVNVVASLPQNASGKVLKHQLRSQVADRGLDQGETT